jgi:hypothetical protein
LAGVSVTGPTAVGVIVNVCPAEELLNVSTVGVDNPPPDGVTVIVPVYNPFGVTVKFVEPAFKAPPAGPVSVYVVADAKGVAEFDAAEAALVPYVFPAFTVHVYAVPFVRPVTTSGLPVPVPVCVPHVAVYVTVAPPVAPAVNVTEICAFPGVAVPTVGVAGGVA